MATLDNDEIAQAIAAGLSNGISYAADALIRAATATGRFLKENGAVLLFLFGCSFVAGGAGALVVLVLR